ncbi:hypothetical protein NMY22_g9137 [Coprinellus aureogranulatus]|nr:hypothetical protein NMY22_g9137 [Coprinellus aureogranulatus]
MPRQSPSFSARFKSFACAFPSCKKVCATARGLKRHTTAKHPLLSSDESENEARPPPKVKYHGKLNGVPVDKAGIRLPPFTAPPKHEPLDTDNPFHPFPSRLAFDFAEYHYVEMQSYGRSDCDPAPWNTAQDLLATIDGIQQGDAPFVTLLFRYSGPLPAQPPAWMTQTYELCVRDLREVIRQQLSTPDFADEFCTAPYRQFQPDGERVWTNLFSGDWAWNEADKIAETVEGSDGAMLVPIVSGLDKTTVSVATGHQEYHPFYVSAGNLTNVARRGHGNGVVPVAFLPIPKTNKRQKKKKEYKEFVRQLYHACIAQIFEPLRSGMSKPEIVRCPDGHFRRAIYSIGPVIADYPEQVWLTGIVQGWCPKCKARPEDLDNPRSARRTQKRTDELLECGFDPGILWSRHGVRDDVVPFTYHFPRADIHELIAPDLLHQVIKGTFKDHLVTWITDYIIQTNGEAKGLEIVADIDRRISAVPIYPGLRRFQDGRDFAQWTGDDSKALMKDKILQVYLAAIAGYVPNEMTQCLASFLEMCYVFRRNAITASALELATLELTKFHELRKIFIEKGVRTTTSLPRQHALSHFVPSIILFGSPNGLCSSITESRHITAVKEPWRRSNRYNALSQMLKTISRLDKMAALHRALQDQGYLEGTTSMATALHLMGQRSTQERTGHTDNNGIPDDDELLDIDSKRDYQLDDVAPSSGPRLASSITLASTHRMFHVPWQIYGGLDNVTEYGYPDKLAELTTYLEEPQFKAAFLEYLFSIRHPTREIPTDIHRYASFSGKIRVYHSAIARFYAPSDACGAGGMQRQTIRCNPNWRGQPRMDTVFVSQSDAPGMPGMLIAQVRLLFSFADSYTKRTHQCALVNWFLTEGDEPDPSTGMWVVRREEIDGIRPLQVIGLDTIVRGAHLLPVYGNGRLQEDFTYVIALDAFDTYFVNPYIDHHAHELLSV